MAKLFLLAGGIVEPGAGQSGAVSAYVAYNPSPAQSRLFKVEGALQAPRVSELPAATTVDLGAFRNELEAELRPTVEAIAARGGTAAIAVPRSSWVTDVVRRHLWEHDGIEVG
jgi:hypothetical protein